MTDRTIGGATRSIGEVPRTPRTEAGRYLLSQLRLSGLVAQPEDAILAIEAEAGAAPPIDVERLAEAIHAVGKQWYLDSGEIEDHYIETNSDQLAAAVLKEYQR